MSRKSPGRKGIDASAKLRELYEEACAARENSYSPYSGHKVGASVRASDGRIYSGCNVENSSYGGTTCAEQTALLKAMSEAGPATRIEEVMVVTDASPPWPPCGLCRQALSEFASPEVMIHSANLSGETVSTRFGELLPRAFTPDHLMKRRKT